MVELQRGLTARQRRLIWRASHRGMRELDLLLGRFARARVPDMAQDRLEELERLLEVPEAELYGWLVLGEPAPPAFDGALLTELRAMSFTPGDYMDRGTIA